MAARRKAAGLHPVQQWLADTLIFFTRPVEIVRSYRRVYLQLDIVAGLTMAVVTLPQAIAFALLSDLPPETGLYTAIVASVVGALWGSSIHLNTGPTNTTSLLVLSTLLTVAQPNTHEYLAAAALMAVMVGVIRLLMGIARLGVMVNFVSDSVIIGLTAGAGILIFVNQLKQLFRLSIPNSPSFFVTLFELLQALPQVHWLSFVLGLLTIALILAVRRVSRRLPGPLIALVAVTALVGIFDLEGQGIIILGELPHGLPPLMALPLTDLELMRNLLVGSLAIAAIGLVEATSIARSIAIHSGQPLDSNQEFVGQGLANIVSGLFSGYTCAGSFTRSGVNFAAGARSPFANIFAGLFVLLALLLLASYTAFIPRAALAGVLLLTASGMIGHIEMRRIWRASRGDSTIMLATLAATLILPLEYAVLAGIIVSIVRFLINTSTPQVHPVVPDKNFRHFVAQRDHPACPQLGVMTVSGPLYFGATQHIEKAIRTNLERHPSQQLLLLRLHLVTHCDISGIHMLESMVRLYRQQGGDIFIAGVRKRVKAEMHLIGFDRFLGLDHFLDRDEAISHLFYKILEPSICIYECPRRIFAECQALPKWEYGSKMPEAVTLAAYQTQSWRPSELKARLGQNGAQLEKKVLVVDVREPAEYQKGHIAQAQLLPLRLIPKQGPTLPKDRPIVLVCRIGRRSRIATAILKNIGYTDVYNLQGGILAWEAAGYPLAVE